MSDHPYQDMLQRHQQERDAFPLKYAFSTPQFQDGMRELGVMNTDDLYRLGKTGGFYRKSDAPALAKMLARHSEERQAGFNDPDALKREAFEWDAYDFEIGHRAMDGFTEALTDVPEVLWLDEDPAIRDNEDLLHGTYKELSEAHEMFAAYTDYEKELGKRSIDMGNAIAVNISDYEKLTQLVGQALDGFHEFMSNLQYPEVCESPLMAAQDILDSYQPKDKALGEESLDALKQEAKDRAAEKNASRTMETGNSRKSPDPER